MSIEYERVQNMQNDVTAIADDTDEDLVSYYLEWTEEAIRDLCALVETLTDDPAPETAQKIYEITHNVKGMGTSFGFPLMTEAGRSLCFYLRRREDGVLDRSVLEAHFKSFKLILAKRMKGDGGKIGRDLVNRLNQLVEHMLAA